MLRVGYVGQAAVNFVKVVFRREEQRAAGLLYCYAEPCAAQYGADRQLKRGKAFAGATVAAEQRHGARRDDFGDMPLARRYRLAVQRAGHDDGQFVGRWRFEQVRKVHRGDSAVKRPFDGATAIVRALPRLVALPLRAGQPHAFDLRRVFRPERQHVDQRLVNRRPGRVAHKVGPAAVPKARELVAIRCGGRATEHGFVGFGGGMIQRRSVEAGRLVARHLRHKRVQGRAAFDYRRVAIYVARHREEAFG
jgi:hypothetical protein